MSIDTTSFSLVRKVLKVMHVEPATTHSAKMIEKIDTEEGRQIYSMVHNSEKIVNFGWDKYVKQKEPEIDIESLSYI